MKKTEKEVEELYWGDLNPRSSSSNEDKYDLYCIGYSDGLGLDTRQCSQPPDSDRDTLRAFYQSAFSEFSKRYDVTTATDWAKKSTESFKEFLRGLQ